MKRNYIILVLFLVSCNKNNSVTKPHRLSKLDYYEHCRNFVLKENIIGQLFLFERKGQEIDQHYVQYLGDIITSKNDTLKVVTSAIYTGISKDAKRGNGKLYIYNSDGTLKGHYTLGSVKSLPNEIENDGTLVFNYSGKDGGCDQITKIDMREEIPNIIFILCRNQQGDIYNFEKDDNLQ